MKLVALPVVYKRLVLEDIELEEEAPDGSYNSVLKELGIQNEEDKTKAFDEEEFMEDVTVTTYVNPKDFKKPHIKGYINRDGSIDDNKCTIEFGPMARRASMVIELSKEELIFKLYGLQVSELG